MMYDALIESGSVIMHTSPRVSVVMGTYNGASYIEGAVASILQQTYTDFEFIIIDDASTDGTWSILEQLSKQDKRVRLHRNQDNLGISATRNLGTEMACGEFIAVMDHDDISVPDRLEKQVAYLDAHPDVGAVGGAIQFLLDDDKLGALMVYPCEPALVMWQTHFQMPACHPAGLVRRSTLLEVGGYDDTYTVSNDYELWYRLSRHTRIANLPDTVLLYRQHTTNYSKQQNGKMFAETLAIVWKAIHAETGIQLSLEETQLVSTLTRRTCPHATLRQVTHLAKTLHKLVFMFRRRYSIAYSDWGVVRADAGSRILWLVRHRSTYSAQGIVALFYTALVDVKSATQWLRFRTGRSVRHRFHRVGKRLETGRVT